MNKTVLSTTGKYPIEHLTNILNKTKETVELAKKYKKETVELAKNYKTETVELAKNYKKEHTNNILEKKNNFVMFEKNKWVSFNELELLTSIWAHLIPYRVSNFLDRDSHCISLLFSFQSFSAVSQYRLMT